MRKLTNAELNKRGCLLCADYRSPIWFPDVKKYSKECIHDECPYHELDDVNSYREYERNTNGKSPLEEYLKKLFDLSEKYIDCQKST